ncbi:MAG TPA: hypothetical protein VFS43_33735 [Polyangiaceae bacterium]|nr:hypothetical protein [Polyangiaceae bacterium]
MGLLGKDPVDPGRVARAFALAQGNQRLNLHFSPRRGRLFCRVGG